MEWGDIGQIIAAVAALGTAAYGLVDTSKVFRGGISNVGYGFLRIALLPFREALELVDKTNPYAVAKANWLNGMDKTEQKTMVKGLIRLGLTKDTAPALAAAVSNIDGTTLGDIAVKINAGQVLTDAEITLLGRFEAVVDARLDAAFERADQKYRNTSKVAAAVVAIVLAEVGALQLFGTLDGGNAAKAFLVGLVAVPIAPIAKDLTSAMTTAVAAFKAVKR
jgi:hypothetical protein